MGHIICYSFQFTSSFHDFDMQSNFLFFFLFYFFAKIQTLDFIIHHLICIFLLLVMTVIAFVKSCILRFLMASLICSHHLALYDWSLGFSCLKSKILLRQSTIVAHNYAAFFSYVICV